MVPTGQSRELHHPWTGPYKIVKRIADSDYRIKGLRGNKCTLILHFDRLKQCIHFTTPLDDSSSVTHQQSQLVKTCTCYILMLILYLPPTQYLTAILNTIVIPIPQIDCTLWLLTEFGTNPLKEGGNVILTQ